MKRCTECGVELAHPLVQFIDYNSPTWDVLCSDHWWERELAFRKGRGVEVERKRKALSDCEDEIEELERELELCEDEGEIDSISSLISTREGERDQVEFELGLLVGFNSLT